MHKIKVFFFIFQKELKKQATAHYMLIHWASVSYKPLSLLICFRYVHLCIPCGLMTKPIFRRREIFVTHFLRVVGIFLVNLLIILSLYVAFKELKSKICISNSLELIEIRGKNTSIKSPVRFISRRYFFKSTVMKQWVIDDDEQINL